MRTDMPLLPHTPVLDHGYLRQVEAWGRGDSGEMEAAIIEAARQSTQGAFRGWEQDERLLGYLYTNKHSTPFEFAGLTIEVRAPIFIFRQWHRHRTQSYNEASGRYRPLPDRYYIPSMDRLMSGALANANKQAGSARHAEVLNQTTALAYRESLTRRCDSFAIEYKRDVDAGVPKELARLGMPLNWYTQMRATANLRNWLAFLTLRMDPHAQWEIRQFAWAVYDIIVATFPRTAQLFTNTLPSIERP